MRYLHTMIRVGNLEKSIKFYSEGLGFQVVKRADYEDGKFTLVFLQSTRGASSSEPLLELTYNWGVSEYEIGAGYGHMAYEVASMKETIESLRKAGYDLSWGPKLDPSGKRAMAFITDPDGYKIELLEA